MTSRLVPMLEGDWGRRPLYRQNQSVVYVRTFLARNLKPRSLLSLIMLTGKRFGLQRLFPRVLPSSPSRKGDCAALGAALLGAKLLMFHQRN